MSVGSASVGVVPKSVPVTESRAPVRAYVGLKPATALGNKPQKSCFTVSNGYKTECGMGVWSPMNNRSFETLSYLPPLTDDEIAKQIFYIVGKDW